MQSNVSKENYIGKRPKYLDLIPKLESITQLIVNEPGRRRYMCVGNPIVACTLVALAIWLLVWRERIAVGGIKIKRRKPIC
jgi:hypothetical protein